MNSYKMTVELWSSGRADLWLKSEEREILIGEDLEGAIASEIARRWNYFPQER